MDNESQKLDKLIAKSRRVIFEADTVFPFDFFPDTIRVDENKVDIIGRRFFAEKHLVSVLIGEIKTVKLSTGPFFATITLDLKRPPRREDDFLVQPINYLWKRDAVRIRRIILGLIVANEEKIDIGKIQISELVRKLEEIGKAREFTSI